MSNALKLVYGVGANDADYQVCLTEMVDGQRRSVWTLPVLQGMDRNAGALL